MRESERVGNKSHREKGENEGTAEDSKEKKKTICEQTQQTRIPARDHFLFLLYFLGCAWVMPPSN